MNQTMKPKLTREVIQNLKFKFLNFELLLILLFGLISVDATAQVQEKAEVPSPRGAFLRSLVMPGWGHLYIDKQDWTRGQIHMGAEAAMILTYAGLKVRTNYLEGNLVTFAMSNANADLDGRGRDYFLAVANFDNLQEYNDYQLRARNWTGILADTPENRWNWNSDEERFRYQDMRERIDRNNNQFPALLTLMVANRVVSGLSAYIKARKIWKNAPEASFSYLNEYGQPGFTANLRFGL